MGTRPLDAWDLCCVSPRATSRGGSRGMSATQRGVGYCRRIFFVLCVPRWIWSEKVVFRGTQIFESQPGNFIVVRDRFVISYLVSRFSSCSHLLVSFLEGRIVKFKKLVYQFTALFASEFPVDSAFHFREFVKYRHSTCYS